MIATPDKHKILVIGAYGLIGHGITRRLIADGYRVSGLGRDPETAKRVLPGVPWITRDMRNMTETTNWDAVLKDVTTVVNCSGALQDGPEDDLETVQHHAVAALASSCAAAKIPLVQISAVGAKHDAPTEFLASKARGDAAIHTAGGRYFIFRPGLVLASTAYGGTTMLRMLAAFPWMQPIAAPDAQIQTVALDDVANAVATAVAGKIPAPFEGDLVEADAHSLGDVVTGIRHWLGFAPARYTLVVPTLGVLFFSKVADGLSRLGWRSPLRSTAIKVLSDGVRGTPSDLTQFGVPPVKPLHQTLAAMPVGVQDRLFARMALVMPLILVTLSLFWLLSGAIGVLRLNEAARVLETAGWAPFLAAASVILFSLIDLGIGVAFAIRKYAKPACWAAIAVSLFYLAASTIAVPALWLDPLGPLVKVIPGTVLALVARIALESR